MYHIVYHSLAIGQPTTADLRYLLQQSRANNNRLSITGLLLYGNGNYLQVLEGEAATIRKMFGVIESDSRHRNVIKLSDGPMPRRTFAGWSMRFQELSEENFTRLMGYLNPDRLGLPSTRAPEADEALNELLRSFCVNEGIQM
ncbi:BLUF domain-containing protein [Hymenobacter rubripertinctus]|uniref:BLUF domain-containing protein n=1 Tax=Hymenobacter rubripertinctus TaxID=2029981 RepID=A0A418QVJ1_9BACT|nr:BLUF domain-containing protein [Hymenobacter rubripertinctus]RIY09217.1 BLUF domain-containing protein [Hymenobacter rubripertinctus]